MELCGSLVRENSDGGRIENLKKGSNAVITIYWDGLKVDLGRCL